ncbi:hypothetical protein E2542_SST20979 [Spatholobus suberectus]|nr:hypothetical protein E2542_SST20979 [Spatholobus suberectus]
MGWNREVEEDHAGTRWKWKWLAVAALRLGYLGFWLEGIFAGEDPNPHKSIIPPFETKVSQVKLLQAL